LKRSVESGGGDLLEVPPDNGLVHWRQHVYHHGRQQRVVVRGAVVDDVDGGHEVLGHTQITLEGLLA
jgi:hypothetical protein